jgi:uncharacterized delta-60 repeat protein
MKSKRKTPNTGTRFEPLETRRLCAAGGLDPSFGAGGKIIAEAMGFKAVDLAVQRDGKIVAVGTGKNDFAVARMNTNGTIDKTFGAKKDGIAIADLGGNAGDFGNAVAIQPDGKIVVAGFRQNKTFDPVLFDEGGFSAARFNADGTLDTSFDGDGKLEIDMPGTWDSSASAIAFQPDGKILLAGYANTLGRFDLRGSKYDWAIARVMPNGALDRTFGRRGAGLGNTGRTGRLTIDFGNDSIGEGANVIKVAPDGKILVGGYSGFDRGGFPVARLTASGDLDSSFDSDGKALQSIRGGGSIADLALEPDGKITAVGRGDGSNFVMVRFNGNGSTDKTLNGNGIVITDMGGKDFATAVRINREGILVAGGSGGKFAMARYRANGQLDSSFGKDGKVLTGMPGSDAIFRATLTSDGKILAHGRSGSMVRYVTALPKVNVFSLRPTGTEGASNKTSLIFTRDKNQSFATRVFYDLGGTARLGQDYTGLPGSTGFQLINGPSGSVVIPAGQSFIEVPINIIDDSLREAAESIEVSLLPSANYALGNDTSETLDITDNDLPPTPIRVNFQAAGINGPVDHLADVGGVFAQRGPLAFGWDADNTANARIRNNKESPDFRYDSLNHMQKNGADRKWEIAVPNGTYMVRLVAGDPSNIDSVYKMNLEGQLALSGTPTGDTRFFRQTTVVQVTDGRLTLSNAPGAVNNRINFLEIQSVAPRTKLGPVASVAARLKNAATANIWQKQPSGLFSDKQIDEALWA